MEWIVLGIAALAVLAIVGWRIDRAETRRDSKRTYVLPEHVNPPRASSYTPRSKTRSTPRPTSRADYDELGAVRERDSGAQFVVPLYDHSSSGSYSDHSSGSSGGYSGGSDSGGSSGGGDSGGGGGGGGGD